MFTIDGKPRVIKFGGPLRVNAMAAIYAAVSEGLGLGYSPLWQIEHLIADRRGELVLEDFEPAPVPIHILWREGRAPTAKVRTFIDLLSRRLKLDHL